MSIDTVHTVENMKNRCAACDKKIPAYFYKHDNSIKTRVFSTRRNFSRAAQFFFVCELSGRANGKKTKKKCAARGKFRLVKNSLYTGIDSEYGLLNVIRTQSHV